MNDQLELSLAVSQTKYLPAGGTQMYAILTVSGQGKGLGSGHAEAAEIILVDCSASMDWPPTKIGAARRATTAAIDTLRDGTHFAIVAGTGEAQMVYPPEPRTAQVTPQTRAEAREAVAKLFASGGTAMGTWLSLARTLLDQHPTAVRHVLLLTDGKNESEAPEQLERVLAQCEGQFVCDARGVGDDWEPRELQRIVSVLRGVADAVRTDSDLVDDFRKLTAAAQDRILPDLRLRITTLPFSRLRFVRQVHPTRSDLTEHCVKVAEGTMEVSTGSWGRDRREYELCLELQPDGRPMGEDVLLATVRLAEVAATPPVQVLGHWTSERVMSTRINSKRAYRAREDELGRAETAGCDAYNAGKLETATEEWGRAVKLAHELGGEESLERLGRVVNIIDRATGKVRLRDDVQKRDLLSLVMDSVISRQADDDTDAAVVDPRPAGPDLRCECGWVSPAGVTWCVKCGSSLGDREPLANRPEGSQQ
ncbi:MAG TPA: VWA domain-containing protein [Mycobacteriales bacterium]|nr:VWA domain-containing protein [Mycobacteriales bacterium]